MKHLHEHYSPSQQPQPKQAEPFDPAFKFRSLNQVMQMLDCSRSFIYTQIKKGNLNPRHLGGKPYFSVEEIHALLGEIASPEVPLATTEEHERWVVKNSSRATLSLSEIIDKIRNYHQMMSSTDSKWIYRMYLYLAKNHRGHTKIGITRDPQEREKTLQTADPDIRMIFNVYTAKQDESLWHTVFDNKRISGEWFDLSDEDISFIKKSYDSCGFDLNRVIEMVQGNFKSLRGDRKVLPCYYKGLS